MQSVTDLPPSDFTALTKGVLLGFVVLAMVGLGRHEMWRDELEVWMLARDSSCLGEMIRVARHSGHPLFWNLVVYPVTRITRQPVAMQVCHFGFALAVVWLVLRWSPFALAQRILFVFGYFPLFEYCVISRNYAPGVMFAFASCIGFAARARSHLPLAIGLALLANTSVYGVIMAVALAATCLLELVAPASPGFNVPARRRDAGLSALVFVAGLALAAGPLLSSSSTDTTAWHTAFDWPRLAQTLATVWNGFVPVPDLSTYRFWNTNILPAQPGLGLAVSASAGLLLLAVATHHLRRHRVLMSGWLIGALGLLLFTYLKRPGYTRQHGQLFVLWFAFLWLARQFPNGAPARSGSKPESGWSACAGNAFLSVLLAIHFAAGMYAFGMDVRHPFSASQNAARYIQAAGFTNTVIMSDWPIRSSPVAGWLDQPVYYPSRGFATYVGYGFIPIHDDQDNLTTATLEFVPAQTATVLWVLNYPLLTRAANEPGHSSRRVQPLVSTAITPHVTLRALTNFTWSIVADEVYYLYLIRYQ